jgi:hypothetical protein
MPEKVHYDLPVALKGRKKEKQEEPKWGHYNDY